MLRQILKDCLDWDLRNGAHCVQLKILIGLDFSMLGNRMSMMSFVSWSTVEFWAERVCGEMRILQVSGLNTKVNSESN